jgi:glutamine synthetase
MKVFLEYIWLDGNATQQLRSKTKVVEHTSVPSKYRVEDYPNWSFDGSSTKQAEAGEGENTDCILKPVYVVDDPFRKETHKLVLCEVFDPNGKEPHKTNHRHNLVNLTKGINLTETYDKSFDKKDLPWFGWEQEYTLMHKMIPFSEGSGVPLGFKMNGEGNVFGPRKQGDYYCGIGSDNVIGRKIAEEHLQKCAEIGLDISGINAEVLLGQWEYQIGPVTAVNGSDQLWISRYVLERVAEEHNVKVSFHPKPLIGEWNGSGCHVNFSTKEMRSEGGIKHIIDTMGRLQNTHKEHIEVYGLDNEKRSNGELETSDINKFSYGFSTRDTSVRIPIQTKIDDKGYFEDRRPASNCDPYRVSERMLMTVYNAVVITEVT